MPSKKKVNHKEQDQLVLRYVPLQTLLQWDRNKKKHDLPTIIKSFMRHGFKDPMKWEPALNGGKGGIAAGNGREEALKVMHAENYKKPPRGIILQEKEWLVPVLYGVDAASQSAAESYAVDHNNIPLAGLGLDMSAIWGDGMPELVNELSISGNVPVTLEAIGYDISLEPEKEKLAEHEEFIRPKTMLRILISVPASQAIEIEKKIRELEKIPGVVIDYSGN